MSTELATIPERFPRLSKDLPYPFDPHYCQSCGADGVAFIWNEHDDDDQIDYVQPGGKHYVSLCRHCSGKLIGPHARLYSMRAENEPEPGIMECCSNCRFREGWRCVSPMLKSMGGDGLPVKHAKPTMAFVDGEGGGRTVTMYAYAPVCDGRQPKEDVIENPD